jgi:hypothetical protein
MLCDPRYLSPRVSAANRWPGDDLLSRQIDGYRSCRRGAKPESRPIHQAVVARDGCLIPAVGWPNYTCEAPFGDAPALSARLEAGLRFVERELQG